MYDFTEKKEGWRDDAEEERWGGGEGWRGGKPAMQHSLNYSSTSEWVASDRKMERSTKREVEREERKGGKR